MHATHHSSGTANNFNRYSRPVKILSRYEKCIWCVRQLSDIATSDRRQRSREHVFPQNIFGRIWTTDCCVRCNSDLGAQIDLKFLDDERVFTAARDAGFSAEQVLNHFEGAGKDGLDRPTRYTVRGGKWRAKPEFHDRGFRIGSINGTPTPSDLANAKRSMLARILHDDKSGISEDEARQCAEALFARFFANGCKEEVRCERTGQRLRSVPGADRIHVERNWFTHHTDWAVAKIVYEAGMTLLPESLIVQVGNAFQQLKSFVETPEERNIFRHEQLQIPASQRHAIEMVAQGNSFDVSVSLFARETWRLHLDVWQSGQLAQMQRCALQLSDDFSLPERNGIKLFLNDSDETEKALE